MIDEQLSLMGYAASEAPVVSAAALVATQREILRLAMRGQGVTTREAGAILHAARNDGRGCRPGRAGAGGVAVGQQPGGAPCCPWMASDGWDALKRLRTRGYVHQRAARGPYYASGATR